MLMPVDTKRVLDAIPDNVCKKEIERAYYKSIPQIVEFDDVLSKNINRNVGRCPTCNKLFVDNYGKYTYCPACGQRIIFPQSKPN